MFAIVLAVFDDSGLHFQATAGNALEHESGVRRAWCLRQMFSEVLVTLIPWPLLHSCLGWLTRELSLQKKVQDMPLR